MRRPKQARGVSRQPDFVLEVKAGGKPWVLACEAKALIQPRHARVAALQLKDYLARERAGNAYGVVLAPYLSPESAAVCAEAGVGYADLAGNCRLSFDRVYVERSGRAKPPAARREQRSLFAPKSARILRLLLGAAPRSWKVVDLASRARVSLGQVSNVRKALLDREWAGEEQDGLRLAKPEAVLSAWREARMHAREERAGYHTLLHGEALEAALRSALAEAGRGEHALLASFSAARWIAPFARSATNWLWADAAGEAILKKRLGLESAARGENVLILRAKDEGVFLDRIEPAAGIWTTGLVQTYLDLAASGERGAEAAEHLYAQMIQPMWKGAR